MVEKFYTILTAAGKAKIANAIPTGQRVNLTKMKFGDSNGAYYNPSENQTDLKNKVYECNVTTVSVDEQNPNWITLTSVIPPEIGGFTIREIGVYDDTNTLIAIGKYPETYKPILDDGSTKELYVKMTLEVSNTNSVELKVDPYIILATKGQVEEVDKRLTSSLEQIDNKTDTFDNFLISQKGRARQKVISFTDDDCRAEVYTKLFKFIKDNNIEYTLACPPGNIGKDRYMNLAQLKEMYEYGVEIMSHTYSEKNLDTATLEQTYEQITKAKDKFKEWGIETYGIAYPQGKTKKENINLISKYHNFGVTVYDGINNFPLPTYYLNRTGILNSDTSINPITGYAQNSMEHCKKMVDLLDEQEDGWLIFMTHAWYDAFDEIKLLELVNYIKSKGIAIKGINKVIRESGNLIDIGYFNGRQYYNDNRFVVACDGTIESLQLTTVKKEKKDSIKHTDIPNTFEKEKILICVINANRNGFPDNTYGVLTTRTLGVYAGDNYSNWLYCNQEFITDNGKVYIRYSNDDGTSWSEWSELSNRTVIKSAKQDISNKPIADYEIGVTYEVIRSAYSSNFPLSRGGILMTVKTTTSAAETNFNYQIYTVYGTGRTFKRMNKDGVWGEWKEDIITNRKYFSITSVSVPANSYTETTVNIEGLNVTSWLNVIREWGLATGLLYNAMCKENGVLTLVFYNMTSKEITLNAGNWQIVYLDK